MAEDIQDKKEYRGPGKFTAAIGRGEVEAGAGLAIGVVGAAAVNKEARTIVSAGFSGIKGLFTKNFDTFGSKLESLGEAGFGKGIKTLAIAAGALTLIGAIHGLYRGAKNASAAKEHVEQLATENEQLQGQVEAQKSFVAKLNAERSAPKTPGQSV